MNAALLTNNKICVNCRYWEEYKVAAEYRGIAAHYVDCGYCEFQPTVSKLKQIINEVKKKARIDGLELESSYNERLQMGGLCEKYYDEQADVEFLLDYDSCCPSFHKNAMCSMGIKKRKWKNLNTLN